MASEKSISLVICTILILFILGYNNNMISSAAAIPSNNSSKGGDIFGIKEIYPTRPEGREWFLNSGS